MGKKQFININLIESLTELVKEVGQSNASRLIQNAKTDKIEIIISELINDTCIVFKVPKYILLNSKTRGTRTIAVSALIYLMCKHLNIRYNDIPRYLPTPLSKSQMSQRTHYIINLDPKISQHQDTINKLDCIEKKLLSKLEQINNNQ